MSIVRKCFLAWLVVWLAGFGAALRGSYWEIPFVWRIVARPRLLALSAAGWAFIYTAILITGLLAVHATVITRDDDRPAPVYMVYEDLDIWPRWVFALGSYRISLAARERYGPDSVVVTRLTRESLAQAIRHGQFVFVGSHGSDQGLLVEHRYLGPPEIKEMGANEHLQFVYLTGCDSGAKVAAWKDALAPAEVLTFDRLSAIVEHAFWLWLKGPDKLRSLPSEA